MKGESFITSTMLRGIIFLIPFSVLLIIAVKLFGLIKSISAPIAKQFEYLGIAGHLAITIATFLIILIIIFLLGLYSKSNMAGRAKDWIEHNILENIPFYAVIKYKAESMVGLNALEKHQVALAPIDGQQIVIIMDELSDGKALVFVPGAPDSSSGYLTLVQKSDLELLQITTKQATKILRSLGSNARTILEAQTS